MSLAELLDRYSPVGKAEVHDLERLRSAARDSELRSRDEPLHITGSALVLDPESSTVLLRWHDRLLRWLQVGGHVDSGDNDPFATARREAIEETGLQDLAAWPGDRPHKPVHIAIVSVPASRDEPAHEHGDIRYVLSTASPASARPERLSAPLRWLEIESAIELVQDENLETFLRRVSRALSGRRG